VSTSLTSPSTWTWTESTSVKDSAGTSLSEQPTVVVGQPTFEYAGPTILRVYVDKIWKTYFFSLDWF
jgi:hypothetical protein